MKTSLVNIVQLFIIIFSGIVGVVNSAPQLTRIPYLDCPADYKMCKEGCRTYFQICNGKRIFDSPYPNAKTPAPATCGAGQRRCREGCRTFGQKCNGRTIPYPTTMTPITTTTEERTNPCGYTQTFCHGTCLDAPNSCDGREIW